MLYAYADRTHERPHSTELSALLHRGPPTGVTAARIVPAGPIAGYFPGSRPTAELVPAD
jgi:hypothetical protein